MENFSVEITDIIINDFSDDEELVKSMLFYLYHTTNDDSMQLKIVDWFNKNNYCIECGNKMDYYEWSEQNELECKTMGCWDCPCCNNERKY